MKRFLLLITILFTLTGCSNNYPTEEIEVYINDSLNDSSAVASPDPEPSNEPSPIFIPTEAPSYPLLDKDITEELTTYMYESFGGFGNEQIAINWYPYIDYWELYQDDDSYYGYLHLNERPFDTSARVILSKYYSDDELDDICPVLMNAGASLNLDDIDLCLIGESLYKIYTLEDSIIHYSSLAALDIPVYEFLASAAGWSVSDVSSAIREGGIPGDVAFEVILEYMTYEYKGAFNGLSMKNVKTMSMAAMANFNNVRIDNITVFDQDGKEIGKYYSFE